MSYQCFEASFTLVSSGDCTEQVTINLIDEGGGFYHRLTTAHDGASFDPGELESLIQQCYKAAQAIGETNDCVLPDSLPEVSDTDSGDRCVICGEPGNHVPADSGDDIRPGNTAQGEDAGNRDAIDLSTCTPGQRLRLRDNSAAEFVGPNPGAGFESYPFLVLHLKPRQCVSYTRLGHFWHDRETDIWDVVEILPVEQ